MVIQEVADNTEVTKGFGHGSNQSTGKYRNTDVVVGTGRSKQGSDQTKDVVRSPAVIRLDCGF